MSKIDYATFSERGATWVRADFHLHTIKEKGASRAEYRAEWANKENEHSQAWIAKLKEQGIQVAVITNHNSFNRHEFKELEKLGARENILVLPGVELGINEGNGIHTLFVFDPQTWIHNTEQENYIGKFIDSQFPNTTYDEGNRTRDSFKECLSCLEEFGKDYFVVFAHIENDNGIRHELNNRSVEQLATSCGELWHKRVLGLQRVSRPDALAEHWPSSPPAAVEGSDPKTFDQVGVCDLPCYLKIGEPSFHAVKFALRDHPQRVSNQIPSLKEKHPRIHSIAFLGGKLDEQKFHLSDQLTSLIGSRGSGKSSVIECLRYGLGLDAGDSDLKYKNSLISAMLQNGGEVHLSGIDQQNQQFTIVRSIGLDPVVHVEGTETRLAPEDILPGLLYFGQKDLGSRNEGFEDNLFSKLIPAPTLEERSEEELLTRSVESAVQEYQSVLNANEKGKEYAQEEERLRHQLAIYKDRGIEAQLEKLTKFDSDKQNLTEFIGELNTFRIKLSNNSPDWDKQLVDWPNLTSPVLSVIAESLITAKADFTSIKNDHHALLGRFDAVLTNLRTQLKLVAEKELQLREEFSKLQREVNAQDLNLEKFRAEKSRHAKLEKLLKAASDKQGMLTQAEEKVKATTNKLHTFWRDWHRKEQEQVAIKNSDLPDTLELVLNHEAKRSAFNEFLKSKLAGTGFRSASRDILVEQFTNGFALYQQRNQLEEILNGTADVQKCQDFIDRNLAELLTFRVPDHRSIAYNGNPISSLSLGQRATALLQLLMSLKDHPILILDQPEDDLDNETIYQQVVFPLLSRKKESQFIIATHNPNIPVLGDSELVHACNEPSQGTYNHSSGSIDSQSTRDAIVNIMEGGEEAFNKRQQVYHEWTNSN